MKKTMVWVFVTGFLCAGFINAQNKTVMVRFFSPKDAHFYCMGSMVSINPYGVYESGGNENKFSMLLGAGWTFIKFAQGHQLTFEFQYSRPSYELLVDDIIESQEIQFLNFLVNFEYFFRKYSFSIFGGFGLSSIRYAENAVFELEAYSASLMNLGFKVIITRNISLRGDFRYYFDPGESEYDYYTEDWYYYSDPFPIGTQYSLGFEINFK